MRARCPEVVCSLLLSKRGPADSLLTFYVSIATRLMLLVAAVGKAWLRTLRTDCRYNSMARVRMLPVNL